MPKAILLTLAQEPDPGTRMVIDADAPGSVPSTDARTVDLYCGQCGTLMASGVPAGPARTAVFRCKLCRDFNDPHLNAMNGGTT